MLSCHKDVSWCFILTICRNRWDLEWYALKSERLEIKMFENITRFDCFNSTTYMVIGPSRAFINIFTSFLFQKNSVNWPVFFNVSFPGICSCYFSADYQVNRTHVFYPIQNLERAFHRFSLHIFSKSGRVCDRDPTRARRGSLLLNCLHSSHLPASE